MRGVIPRLYTGLYATPGPPLAAPPAFNPHRQKYENYRPKNKMNTARRRRRRRDNTLTNQLFFQLWSGLVIQKPWGCTRGCDAQALAQALKNATVSYFCLYAVVPWVVRSPEIQLLSNLVLTNVSHFCLCWGLYEGCARSFDDRCHTQQYYTACSLQHLEDTC